MRGAIWALVRGCKCRFDKAIHEKMTIATR